MVCPPVRLIIHELKLVDSLRTGGKNMFYILRKHAVAQSVNKVNNALSTTSGLSASLQESSFDEVASIRSK